MTNRWHPSPVVLLCTALLVWLGLEAIQSRLSLSPGFAVVDVLAHASVALVCLLPIAPMWGYRPVLVAVLAASLIDVDHALAARSLDPMRMMSLGARPPTHSLAGALLLAVLVGALLGGRAGYATFVGVISHVLRDADGPPGVWLFAPFAGDAHVTLPLSVLPVSIVILAAGGVLLAWAAHLRKQKPKTTDFPRPRLQRDP